MASDLPGIREFLLRQPNRASIIDNAWSIAYTQKGLNIPLARSTSLFRVLLMSGIVWHYP
jgi:hypothetical protein